MIHKSRRDLHAAPEKVVDVFLRLAAAASVRRRTLQEDKFLVLAACAAQDAGYSDIADDCLARIKEHNADHMLGRHACMAQALQSEEVVEYTDQLRTIYPLEKAEYLLLKFRASECSEDHAYGERLSVRPSSSRPGDKAAKGRRAKGRPDDAAAASRAPAPSTPDASDALPLPLPPERSWIGGSRRVALAFFAGAAVGLALGMGLGQDPFERIATALGLQRP